MDSRESSSSQVKKPKAIYFLGIGGTGMASVAGLCQEAGYTVRGSDAGVYPPTSTMLEQLQIAYKTPYHPDNLSGVKPDLVVVANVLSRGNAELEKVIADGIPYTSFPKFLGENFLHERISCVVAGTHGKTTTTALLAHVLSELGENPGFLIGGLPKNFNRSFLLGKGKTFVIEGDEYDTAFFDKGPKFLHYHPKHLILNNIEYDHADIYKNLESVEKSFEQLLTLVADPSLIMANVDDPGVCNVLKQMGLTNKTGSCSGFGLNPKAGIRVEQVKPQPSEPGQPVPYWQATIQTSQWGSLEVVSKLTGRHNFANIGQVIGCLEKLGRAGHLQRPVDKKLLVAAVKSFDPPKRRLDLLGEVNGALVFEDFAHHPTAVKLVLETLRLMYPSRKLKVAFEPRSATNRRNVFHDQYVQSLGLADSVLIGESMLDLRIPEGERFSAAKLVKDIGSKAESFGTNIDLVEHLKKSIKPQDVIVFMSSGSFSGIQHLLLKQPF